MNVTDWNTVGEAYSAIRDKLRDTVFVFVQEQLQRLGPNRLMDYGGGDGTFAMLAAKDSSVETIVTYDPALVMTALAKLKCAGERRIRVIETTTDLVTGRFDAVTFNAVWMCLQTRAACLDVLREIARLLSPNGHLVATVTHPCFRTQAFSTFSTDFDEGDYFSGGTQFTVALSDGQRTLRLTDTHWNLSDMASQLAECGFAIEDLWELPDSINRTNKGSPWLVISAIKCRL